MDRVTFDKVVTDQLSRSELLLTSKGHEYAEKAEAGTEVDRLEHFKKAAVLQGETTEQAMPLSAQSRPLSHEWERAGG